MNILFERFINVVKIHRCARGIFGIAGCAATSLFATSAFGDACQKKDVCLQICEKYKAQGSSVCDVACEDVASACSKEASTRRELNEKQKASRPANKSTSESKPSRTESSTQSAISSNGLPKCPTTPDGKVFSAFEDWYEGNCCVALATETGKYSTFNEVLRVTSKDGYQTMNLTPAQCENLKKISIQRYRDGWR